MRTAWCSSDTSDQDSPGRGTPGGSTLTNKHMKHTLPTLLLLISYATPASAQHVKIYATTPTQTSYVSGTAIGDGTTILTCRHFLSPPPVTITVVHPNSTPQRATILRTHATADLAALKIANPLPTLPTSPTINMRTVGLTYTGYGYPNTSTSLRRATGRTSSVTVTDPNSWTGTAPLPQGCSGGAATVLYEGRELLCGVYTGYLGTAAHQSPNT